MGRLDWIILSLFFMTLICVGAWSYLRIKKTDDFYVAGGRLPWWLSGVSHHVSGYSGVVFTGYAAVAYAFGFTLYIWWALVIAIACFLGSAILAPRWSRLHQNLGVQSPTEYLEKRYNKSTQLLIAISGTLLKLLDVAAKFAAIGILMNGFTGVDISTGILITGLVAMLYITVGGLWADTINDFVQFIVQVIAGMVMFVVVAKELGGLDMNYFTMWSALPKGHGSFFNGDYSIWFFLSFFFVVFLSYNGGTWNLAFRFIASPSGEEAKKGMRLSGVLYLIWPLIMFAPMWASPLLFPDLAASEHKNVYSMLTTTYLPAGLIGAVLASMFAATLSMIASDANAISSVIVRDIIPSFQHKSKEKSSLWMARLVTFTFTLITLIIALNRDYFGGVLGLIIKWFGGLVGPTSIPMVLGLLPFFKYCGPKAAWATIFGGLFAFIVVNYVVQNPPLALSIAAPVLTSLVIFVTAAIVNRSKDIPEDVEILMEKLKSDHG